MVHKSRKWTGDDEKFLRKNYPKISAERLASRFNASVKDLNEKLKELGLIKTAKKIAGKKPAAVIKQKAPAKTAAPKEHKKAGKSADAKKITKKVAEQPKKMKEAKKSKKISVSVKSKKSEPAVAPKPPLVIPPPPRVNIRCRYCFLVDGYAGTEKVCHYCGAEVYEIDKI